MRRLGLSLLVVLTMAACRAVATPGNQTGAASSQEAVMAFLAGAKSQDLQAISAVWGSEEGLTRDRVSRQELERRLLIITCHLRHDESRIGPPRLGEAGRTLINVDVVKGANRATVPFTTVKHRKSNRWYVEDVDIRPARAICNAEPMSRPVPPSR